MAIEPCRIGPQDQEESTCQQNLGHPGCPEQWEPKWLHNPRLSRDPQSGRIQIGDAMPAILGCLDSCSIWCSCFSCLGRGWPSRMARCVVVHWALLWLPRVTGAPVVKLFYNPDPREYSILPKGRDTEKQPLQPVRVPADGACAPFSEVWLVNDAACCLLQSSELVNLKDHLWTFARRRACATLAPINTWIFPALRLSNGCLLLKAHTMNPRNCVPILQYTRDKTRNEEEQQKQNRGGYNFEGGWGLRIYSSGKHP